MRVEWTSYSSPIGALTVVECEAGPLVVEFPHRATTIKWAVRLRSAVPELHLGQGPCRATTTWLDEYFAGSARAFPLPRSPEALVRSLPGAGGGLQDPAEDPGRRDPKLRRRRPRHRAAPAPDRLARRGQSPGDPHPLPPRRGEGRRAGRLRRRPGRASAGCSTTSSRGGGGTEVGSPTPPASPDDAEACASPTVPPPRMPARRSVLY